MNKPQPRNRSTNTRALSTRIDNIRTEIRPTLTITSVGSNPAAAPLAKYVWLSRRVRCYLTATSGTATLGISDIAGALGTTGRIKVLGIKVWNLPTNGSSDLTLTTSGDLTISGATMSATDYGSGSNMAGLKVNVPDPLAKTYALTATNTFANITSVTSSTPKYIVDINLLFTVDAA